MNPVDSSITTVRTQKSDIGQGAQSSGDVAASATARKGVEGAPSGDSAAESVSFTQTAADLLQLETQLRELPGIDQARVDTIRQAINDGSYEVDAEKIVENLLKSERELT
ncbi:MAG: flagellar biosynthesis anti-sigma factor FlgM [Congregibacter sp.]